MAAAPCPVRLRLPRFCRTQAVPGGATHPWSSPKVVVFHRNPVREVRAHRTAHRAPHRAHRTARTAHRASGAIIQRRRLPSPSRDVRKHLTSAPAFSTLFQHPAWLAHAWHFGTSLSKSPLLGMEVSRNSRRRTFRWCMMHLEGSPKKPLLKSSVTASLPGP